MNPPSDPAATWSALAPTAQFAHPVDVPRLARWLPLDAPVLDVGCGWGRVAAELRGHGWTRVTGVDFAEGMILRGRAENPGIDLRVADGRRLPFADRSFDGALLFAVLTCIPSDDDQRALVAEVRRVVAPGGLVCVSDLLLNSDARNRQRYEQGRDLGRYGCFRVDGGAICRHHDAGWIDELFAGFETLAWVPFVATTMHGHTSKAFRLFARRRIDGARVR